jgi:hypothetical protein
MCDTLIVLNEQQQLRSSALMQERKKRNIKMSNFTRNLLSEFKSFVKDETKLVLDFRTHVFLENQYGAYPEYSYSDAETVIDCVYNFLDAHFVDYSGRFNRSMDIEALRTTKLKDFLLERLTSEIEKPLFYAVKNDKFTTKIIKCEIADYDENGSTIEVTAEDVLGEQVIFHVQTVDQEYRSDLGCWITTLESDGDLCDSDYPTFDLGVISNAAENHIKESQEIKHISLDYYLKDGLDGFVVLKRNSQFINSATSSYQREYDELETFSDEDDALEFIKQL